MRTITEWLLFREATTTELGIFDGASDVALGIDEIHCSGNTDRSTVGIDEGSYVLCCVL